MGVLALLRVGGFGTGLGFTFSVRVKGKVKGLV